MSAIIHPETKRLFDAVTAKAPHALLLTGPEGIGLSTIAGEYAAALPGQAITVLPEKDEKIDVEKGIITVASIRRLYDLTRTIEPNGRVVIIDYVERMAAPAQNAFLKLLEEPSEGTHFILLTHQPELLLPTITSRAQRIDIRPATSKQSEDLLTKLGVTDTVRRSQLLFVAYGLPAELTRLATDEAYFNARADIIRDAREFAQGRPYQRLILAKKYKDDRKAALLLLEDAMKMLRSALYRDGDTHYLRLLNHYEKLHKRLSEQGNVRLQLSAAVV